MRKFLITALVLLVVITAFSVFATVSFADADSNVNVGDVPTTLSVPAGQNYQFFAQTRTNRLNSNNKDVRIICVADQEWLTSVPNFVATFTFTDGTTPKTLKSVGLDMVFKTIVAYGTDAQVETYTAAEGAVIFGWVITDVPAEYADVATNKPTIAVDTAADATPELDITTPEYDTPIEKMDTINVETDGIYKSVETNINGKVGGFDHGDSRATYILSGNYEGIYELEVFYTCRDGNRGLIITANGVSQNYQIMTRTESWDDVSTALSFKIQVQLKKGANVISFSKSGNYAGFNVVDFNLKKLYDLPTGESTTVMAPTDKNDENDTWTFEGGVAIEDADNGFKKLGWLTKDNKAISTITVDEAGDYLLAVYYLNDDTTYDSPRILKVTVNGEENYFQPVKTDTWGDTTRAVAAYLKVTLTEGENTIVISGGQGGIYKEGDGRTDAPPFIKYILTAYEN